VFFQVSEGKARRELGNRQEVWMSWTKRRNFPISAGILFGLGLGGFFDGIVLHQVLQWHHMLTSAGYPADSVPNLEVNTLWDGLFHASTYVFVLFGLIVLWRKAHRTHVQWSGKLLVGTMLMGFGIFNLVEGLSTTTSSASTTSTRPCRAISGSGGISVS
jgi:uncharacterized membrane protein